MKISEKIKKIVFSAFFLAVGMVLPFITGQVRDIGNMFLPMHLPVFLCGLIVGAPYGLIVGIILPIFRSMIFGMPIFFKAIGMSFELATYGFVSAYIYEKAKHKCIISLYKALIVSMLFGRIVWGLVSIFLYGISGTSFTVATFIVYAFINAIPGIVLQLVSIPMIMLLVSKTHLVKINKKSKAFTFTILLLCLLLTACEKEVSESIQVKRIDEMSSTDLIDGTINEASKKIKQNATISIINEEKKEQKIIERIPVYLTFDDGPGKYTDELLELFDKYNAKVTYFCTKNSDVIRERIKKIYEKGHTLGVHSYSHDAKKIYESEDAYFADLIAEEEVIKESVGFHTRYIRLPYGSSNTLSNFNPGIITRITKMLKDAGFEYFDWNVSAEEKTKYQGGKMIPEVALEIAKSQIERVKVFNKNQPIMILSHDTSEVALEYIKLLVEYLYENGYEMKGIDDNTTPVHHTILN